jgi:2-oxoglutarate dehydrogenase E2 component (dihydrolipoamide succinyltransferase)
MPSLGESVEEGTLTKWLKIKGEAVEEFEPLLEVNTDKVDTEVPSPAAGVLLEILVQEGSTVQAGQLLAWIGEAGEISPIGMPEGKAISGKTVEAAPLVEDTAVTATAPAITPKPGRDRELGFISPVVAKIAAEKNIDLTQVPGSGQGGRITKKDILAYLERRAEPVPAVPAAPTTIPATPPIPPRSQPVPATAPLPGQVMPLNTIRRAIAEHMLRSKHTSPHVSTIMEVDLSAVIAHREANKDAFARDGARLTFTPYFVSASVAALKAYPIVNGSWSDEGIVLHRAIHIGMATSLGEDGLIVPVIKNAETLSLLGLARQVNDLAERARLRKLLPDEVQGGTFTITNHGVSGSLFATPIINQPQCAILGVGVIQKRVVVVSDKALGDAIVIRPMAYLSLTFDHRVLDGAIADYFLGKVVETLQNWR